MTLRLTPMLAVVLFAVVAACAGSSGSATPPTGQSCNQPTQCYPDVDRTAIRGAVACLTSLQDGYCTHACQTDQDCCAATGECPPGITEVCAPLESTGTTYCFVSCQTADASTDDAGAASANAYCQQWAGPAFTCRSTGGGSTNVRFCGP